MFNACGATLSTYVYDLNGNLTSATYDPTSLDPSGVNQVTTYKYDANNRLNEVHKPDGSVVTFTYDADGNRTSKSVTVAGTTTTTVNDVYQNGQLAYQTDGSGTLLATSRTTTTASPRACRWGATRRPPRAITMSTTGLATW